LTPADTSQRRCAVLLLFQEPINCETLTPAIGDILKTKGQGCKLDITITI